MIQETEKSEMVAGMGDMRLMVFLEETLKIVVENSPKKIVVAYLEEDGGVALSYKNCNYRDLQCMGQELINEGTLRLIAESEDRIEEIKNEPEDLEDG